MIAFDRALVEETAILKEYLWQRLLASGSIAGELVSLPGFYRVADYAQLKAEQSELLTQLKAEHAERLAYYGDQSNRKRVIQDAAEHALWEILDFRNLTAEWAANPVCKLAEAFAYTTDKHEEFMGRIEKTENKARQEMHLSGWSHRRQLNHVRESWNRP